MIFKMPKVRRKDSLFSFWAILCLLIAGLLAFQLLSAYRSGDSFLLKIDAPTTYDGLSYYNEIFAFQSVILGFNFIDLIKSYGALVVLVYSPVVIAPEIAFWWPFVVNIALLIASSWYLFCALLDVKRNIVEFSGNSQLPNKLYDVINVRQAPVLALLGPTFLILLNPYYIASLFVPSKDIISLFISTLFLRSVFAVYCNIEPCSGKAALPPRLFLLIAAAFFVRITLFFSLLLVFLFAAFSRSGRLKVKPQPICCFFATSVAVSALFLALQNVTFESDGSAINSVLSSSLKFFAIPLLPLIYSSWDFVKSPFVSSGGINVVQVSFSLFSVVVASLLLPFFFSILPINVGHGSASALSNSLLSLSAIAIAVPMCSGYVHTRYLYEFLPWLLLSLSSRYGYSYLGFWVFRILPASCSIKLFLGILGLLRISNNLPVYELAPFLK